MKSRSKFANKPSGNDEYEQVIAETINFNNGTLIQEMKMNAPTITLDRPGGNVQPQQSAEVTELHEQRIQQEDQLVDESLDETEGDVEPQQIIAEVAAYHGQRIQQDELGDKSLDQTEGSVEPQQIIAEVAAYHEQRLKQEVDVEEKNKSPIKPQGDEEYEQMIAESSVFTTKQKIEEAAYFIAQRRGFSPGNELSDWYQAETEIEARQVSDSKLCLVNL